jgi:hypothetical protein
MKTTSCIALIAGTGVAFAQPKDSKPAPKEPPKEAPKPPTPSKDLDALKGWDKVWTCTGSAMGQDKVNAKLTIKRDLDGFWYSARFEVPKQGKMPGAFIGQATLGIDPGTKGWIAEGFDNHGGVIRMKVTISGGTMTWDGEAIDEKKQPAKFTFTVDDKKKMKFVGEFSGQKAFDHDCK